MPLLPKRRWLRFTIRTLLFLLLLAGCFFGWLAARLRFAAQQRDAVAAIEETGGYFEYDTHVDHNLKKRPTPKEDGLQRLRDRLGRHFFDTPIILYLYNSQDVALQSQKLPELPHIKWIGLGGSSVCDADLQRVSQLQELRSLNLRATPVSDTGVLALRSLRLEMLDLMGCPVTDASVPVLSKLSTLTFLNLCGTQITSEGLAVLQRALPSCVIRSGAVALVPRSPEDKLHALLPPEYRYTATGLNPDWEGVK